MAAKKFAISAGNQWTAQAGAEVLRAGGNAVDGVLAAAFTSFMAEPIMSQPYGGGFLLVQQKGAKADLIDFYGHTPAQVPPKEGLDNQVIEANFGQTTQSFHIGAGTIAVSGLAQGFSAAVERFGTMNLPELAAQAILLARIGLKLDARQADIFQVVQAVLETNPKATALYGKEGRLLKEGEWWQNEDLANALECWAREGADFMSKGEAARAVLAQTETGGAVREADMRDYEVRFPTPLGFGFGAYQVFANPPPSAGGVLVQLALTLLEQSKSPRAIADALALVYEARKAMGHLDDPSQGERLLSKAVLDDLRFRPKSFRGTTHIAAIDGRGQAASISLTNGAGSGLIAAGTGIHLNDMLGEPELVPKSEGAFPAGVRLCSMMSPMIASSSDDFIALGAAGSTRIPSALVQVLLPLLGGSTCAQALAKPRVHFEAGKVSFEDFFESKERAELLAAYPQAEVWDERAMFFGGVNVAMLNSNGFDGAGDPRRNSAAIVER